MFALPRPAAYHVVAAALAITGLHASAGCDPDDEPTGLPPPSCSWSAFDGPKNLCGLAADSAPLLVSRLDSVLDTDAGVLKTGTLEERLPNFLMTRPSGVLQVISLQTLQVDIGRTLVITGSLPVLFVVHGDVFIGGTIDASAVSALSRPGPGGDQSICGRTGGAGNGDGGGGGFAGAGGAANGPPSKGGMPAVPLRGGCPGASSSSNMSKGGSGGGGVGIAAEGKITVIGTIMANGTPGMGGITLPGFATLETGAGGGSGGAIVLEGASVELRATARLCANGGGGGEGSEIAGPGAPGTAPTCTSTPAAGGSGAGDGGDGGAGGAGATLDGAAGGTASPKGGGGGGAGWILLKARTAGGLSNASQVISPPHQTLP